MVTLLTPNTSILKLIRCNSMLTATAQICHAGPLNIVWYTSLWSKESSPSHPPPHQNDTYKTQAHNTTQHRSMPSPENWGGGLRSLIWLANSHRGWQNPKLGTRDILWHTYLPTYTYTFSYDYKWAHSCRLTQCHSSNKALRWLIHFMNVGSTFQYFCYLKIDTLIVSPRCVHEKHVHSTLAQQKFSERNPPH